MHRRGKGRKPEGDTITKDIVECDVKFSRAVWRLFFKLIKTDDDLDEELNGLLEIHGYKN